MHKSSRLSILTAAVILAMLFSAFPLSAVMAEGEEPAPPEIPVTEEVPAAQEEAPPALEEAPLTVAEVADQAPEGVAVVPVGSSGEVLPIVEEATVNSYVTGDPIYCPGSAVWGDAACSEALPSIEAALAEAATKGSGTIYVAVDYTDNTPTKLIIEGDTGPNGFEWLNLVGGVDFATGKIIGKTVLNRPVQVVHLGSFSMQNFIISGTTGYGLEVRETEDAHVLNSEINNSSSHGLYMDLYGDAILEDVNLEKNSYASHTKANTINLYNVSASGNTNYGMHLSSTKDTMVAFSKFDDNGDSGLIVNSHGSIYIHCSQAANNGKSVWSGSPMKVGVGMELERSNDIVLLCNNLIGNRGYGLYLPTADAEDKLYLGSTTISGNGDDSIPASAVIQEVSCSHVCSSCGSGGSGGEEEKPAAGNTQVVIAKVGEGNGTAEIKPGYSTVFKLYEEKEDKERLVQLTALPSGSAPSGSSAVYTALEESNLPAPLPEGASLIPWGINLAITNPDGSAVESLIGYMLVRFYLPEGFVLPGGMRLAIQYFDPATSSWEPVSTGVGGGTAYTFASKPGTYVLTMVPIQ